MLDAHIDAFEGRVHKILAEDQPLDLSVFREELGKFKAYLTSS